jgi:chorismate mutase
VTAMAAPLDGFRRAIDAIDDQLVDLLAERFAVVRAVASVKQREGLSVVQAERARAVVERNMARAAGRGLDPELVRRLWTLVIDTAHRIEDDIVSAGGADRDGGAE